MLRIFVEAGAPEEILYDARPHLGTDLLVRIVENIRNRILEAGGEVRFRSKAADLILRDGRVRGVRLSDGEELETEVVVLATGHSARDTFSMLHDRGLQMQPKSFAVGVRVEHPQRLITERQSTGRTLRPLLEPQPTGWPIRWKTAGASIPSACVPAAMWSMLLRSRKRLAVNGMSYHRAGLP